MKKLQQLIDGTTPLYKNTHIHCDKHFDDKGYKEIKPYQQKTNQKINTRIL